MTKRTQQRKKVDDAKIESQVAETKKVDEQPIQSKSQKATEVEQPVKTPRNSDGKKAKVKNVTRYPKVNPNTGDVFPAQMILEDIEVDSWVELQIAAGILQKVE